MLPQHTKHPNGVDIGGWRIRSEKHPILNSAELEAYVVGFFLLLSAELSCAPCTYVHTLLALSRGSAPCSSTLPSALLCHSRMPLLCYA